MGRILTRPTSGGGGGELTAADFSSQFLNTTAGASTPWQVKAKKDGRVANGLVVSNTYTGTAYITPPGGTGNVVVDIIPNIISKIEVNRTEVYNAGKSAMLRGQIIDSSSLSNDTGSGQTTKNTIVHARAGDVLITVAMAGMSGGRVNVYKGNQKIDDNGNRWQEGLITSFYNIVEESDYRVEYHLNGRTTNWAVFSITIIRKD